MSDFETLIEKVGFQGDGLTVGGLVVPLSLPGERVRVRAGKANISDSRHELIEVLDASLDRTTPPCPHFSACGGCSLQHWALPAYSAWKKDMVEVLLRRGGLETVVHPILTTPPQTRRRVGLHARKIGPKNNAPVELGFKTRKSWNLVGIHECPVSDPAITAALSQLKSLAGYLFEHPKSAPILHVTVSLTGLDIDISGVERNKSGGLSADARMNVAMLAAEADFARVTMGEDMLYMSRTPMVRFGQARVGLPVGAFLQASSVSEAEMVRLVVEGIGAAKKVADLFCGAGTFTYPLAEKAVVYAADGSVPAIASLRAAMASAPGLKTITPEARDLYRRPWLAEEMKGFDAVVFDPPRAGAEAQTAEIARSSIGRVVAVSCNPTTFIRDAKMLVNAGFSLDSVTPIDQFLWSSHVELVAVFSR